MVLKLIRFDSVELLFNLVIRCNCGEIFEVEMFDFTFQANDEEIECPNCHKKAKLDFKSTITIS